MRGGRWYPTNTPLASGDVLVVSGSKRREDGALIVNSLPQVWQVALGTWRTLIGANRRLLSLGAAPASFVTVK